METKSRYEVISDLEEKKRELISEKRGLNDVVIAKENKIKQHDRNFEDTKREFDRKREDLEDDLKNFKDSLTEREETLQELIASIDKSLEKFNQK